MKEATGEANITVITIVLIAIVLAVGTVIVNSVLNSSKRSAACNAAGGYWHSGQCCTNKKCSGTDNKVMSCAEATNADITAGYAEKGDFICK